jgi:hypothetical protein
MRITPSDQPSNSDLSYRAGRWIALAIARLAGASAKLAPGRANMRRRVLGNRQKAGKEVETTIGDCGWQMKQHVGILMR